METGTVGLIKVAYTEPGNKQLHSKMFDTVKDAIPFLAGKQNALIFQMATHNGDRYDWELLPFGDYKAYKIGMFVKNNLLELGLLLVGVGFAVHYTLKAKGIKLFVREGVKVAATEPPPVPPAEPVIDPPPTPEPTPKTE